MKIEVHVYSCVCKILHTVSRVNLSAYFQKIFGAEKGLIDFGAHFGAKEAGLLSVSLLYQTIDIDYSLVHTRAQNCLCSKIFGTEVHRDSPLCNKNFPVWMLGKSCTLLGKVHHFEILISLCQEGFGS